MDLRRIMQKSLFPKFLDHQRADPPRNSLLKPRRRLIDGNLQLLVIGSEAN